MQNDSSSAKSFCNDISKKEDSCSANSGVANEFDKLNHNRLGTNDKEIQILEEDVVFLKLSI